MLLIFLNIFSIGVNTKSLASLENKIAANARTTQTNIVRNIDNIALTFAFLLLL